MTLKRFMTVLTFVAAGVAAANAVAAVDPAVPSRRV
jgi:phosphate transport system substrate-binding protein